MKVKFLEDTIDFSAGEYYHKMSFKVQLYYHDGTPMEQRTMVVTYDIKECSMSFANDDDFYGHGMHFNFNMIKKFRKYLKSVGVEIT